MLGLPRSESMRCRLLLGVFVSTANASNPTDAFTRSRNTSLAACGSPLRKSVAASSRSALAKAGSRATRAATVFLKSRVRAIVLPLTLGFCRRSLSGLVFSKQRLRALNIGLLAFLGATGQQDDQFGPVSTQINPVARAPVDPEFSNSAYPFDVRRVAQF